MWEGRDVDVSATAKATDADGGVPAAQRLRALFYCFNDRHFFRAQSVTEAGGGAKTSKV